MAEALVAAGLVGTIIQLVDFSTKVIARLNELRSSTENAPNAFQSVYVQLRLLRSNLEKTEAWARAVQLDGDAKGDIDAVVQGCLHQIERVDALLNRILPAKGDSRLRRGMKILLSVHQEQDLREITKCIESYVLHLIHYHTLSVHTTLPLRPSAKRMPSFSTLPYPRDPHFAGRKDLIRQLDQLFLSGSRAALSGLGGIGKSQIAIEFSHRFQEMDPGAIILWVYASSIARIDEAYKDIARKAQLPGFDDPSVSKLELVSNWLREDASGSWLIVIDNADTEDTFFKPVDSMLSSGTPKSIIDFIPSAPNGKALITSRNRMVAAKLTHRACVVEVPNLTQAEGRQMLENAVGKDKLEAEDDVNRLLEALEHLPLAISQAAAFIDMNDITIAEYLSILDGGDHDFVNVLSDGIEDSRRDRESLNSVIASWMLSFEYLRAQKPYAAELLSLMSMFDCKSVPERLLLNKHHRRLDFIKAIGTLKSFSLVHEDGNRKAYTVHRLVHLATRAWIEKDDNVARWHKTALEAVDSVYPAGEIEQWSECNELEPHAEAVFVSEDNDEGHRDQMVSLLLRSARDRYHQYRYDTALERIDKALKIEHGLHGALAETVQVAKCLQMKSWCQFAKRDYSSTIQSAQLAHAIFEKCLGADAEETMRAKSNLSKFLTKNGELDKAYEVQIALLRIQRQKLGDYHTDVLYTMNRLVNTLRRQKKNKEALEVSNALVTARRKAFGDNNQATLVALSNNASLLYDTGNTEDGLAIMKRVYEGQRSTIGEDHPITKETLAVLQQYESEIEARKAAVLNSTTVAEAQQHQQSELVFKPVLGSPEAVPSQWSLP